MSQLTSKQLEVLIDVICNNRPWEGVKQGDGRRVKVLERLVGESYISISYNGNLAWATDKGLTYVRQLLPSGMEI